MKRLFIAEKPSLARAIAGELGGAVTRSNYIECGDDTVTWCFGHLLETAPPHHYDPKYSAWRMADLPIVPQQWALLPKDDDSAKQLALIAQLIGRADTVVHAGDPDREGQLLVDQALDHAGNTKPVTRFWASAQDSVSIRRALAELKPNEGFRRFGHAAVARSRADWLVGMNLSRLFTLRARQAGADIVIPIGRVQTTVLQILEDRRLSIGNFKPVAHHTLAAILRHPEGVFRAAWRPRDDQDGLDSEGRLTATAVADALVKRLTGQQATITEYKQEPKKTNHPRAYSLSDIALAASNKWGYSSQEVLDAVQGLYEKKLTSYPRTDCDYLPESQHADAGAVLAALRQVTPVFAKLIDAADPKIKSKTWDDAKVTAHHGIIPTAHITSLAALSEVERNIHGLIVRSYVAQFHPLHQYMQTSVVLGVDGEVFAASGKVVTCNGWRDVYQEQGNEEGAGAEADDDQALPAMAEGETVPCESVERRDQKTKPLPQFSEASLQKAMENVHRLIEDPEERKLLKDGDGIGTPATRAAMLTELKAKGLAVLNGKHITTGAAPRLFLQLLPPVVRSPSMTAQFERVLKAIERGDAEPAAFVQAQTQFVSAIVAEGMGKPLPIKATSPQCPSCKTGFLFRREKSKKTGYFWACGNNEGGCSALFTDVDGQPDLTPRPPCPTCGKGKLWRRDSDKDGKLTHFWSCDAFKEHGCRASFPDEAGKPNLTPRPACPTCGKGSLWRRHRADKTGYFWSCSAFKEHGCKASFDDANGKPDFAPKVTHPCPTCSTGKLNRLNGANGKFWACSGYQQGCRTTFPDTASGPDFNRTKKGAA